MRKLQHEEREKSWPLSSVVSLSEEIDIAWIEGKNIQLHVLYTHQHTICSGTGSYDTCIRSRFFHVVDVDEMNVCSRLERDVFCSYNVHYVILQQSIFTDRTNARQKREKNCLRQCLIIIAVCVRDYHIAHNAHWTQMAVKWIFSKSRSGMLHNSTEYLSSRLSTSPSVSPKVSRWISFWNKWNNCTRFATRCRRLCFLIAFDQCTDSICTYFSLSPSTSHTHRPHASIGRCKPVQSPWICHKKKISFHQFWMRLR